MRTSSTQFEMMVTYMEQHGDLSKPCSNARDRLNNLKNWEELVQLLNSDGAGDSKTLEKWKKVWSDFKNNTKKKAARLHRAVVGTGGGLANLAKLSDLEQRLLRLVGMEVATGLAVEEAGLTQASLNVQPPQSQPIQMVIDVEFAPLCVKLATNHGNNVQAEEADTAQKSKQVFDIYNGAPDNRPFDTDGVTNINSLANRVGKLYDVFIKPETFVPLQNESLAIAQRAANTVSEDFNLHVASRNENIGSVTNKMNVNNGIVSKSSQSEAKVSNNIDPSENSLLSQRNLFTCDACKKTLKRKSHLVKHIKTHSEVKPFSCKFCQYKSKHKRVLKTHMRTHTSEKLFSCKFCDYRFVRKSDLVRHMRSHTGERPYLCKFCDYRCAQKSNLLSHMRSHTGEKPYLCKLCDFRSAYKNNLVHHMSLHTGKTPYLCKLCDYRCAQKSHLVSHLRSHTGEKPYLCNLCDYRFTQKYNLLKHMSSHTGEKPYLCKFCDYKCALKFNLVSHMRIHTGEKPFPCQLCDYKSARKSSLVRHMRTHTVEKPYMYL